MAEKVGGQTTENDRLPHVSLRVRRSGRNRQKVSRADTCSCRGPDNKLLVAVGARKGALGT